MSSQYEYIKSDDRNNFQQKVRARRINSSVVPELAETIRIASMPAKIFPVSSTEELELLTAEYRDAITTGNLAIMYNDNDAINRLYVWGKSDEGEGWEILINSDKDTHSVDGGIF